MIKKRAASILFLTAGLLLLLAYLFFAHFFDLLYRLGGRGEWSAALSAFFSPGYANAPGQWLRAELIKFGMATASLAALAIAAVQRDGWWTSIGAARALRLYWRQWIWAVLLASSGLGLAYLLLDMVAPFGMERRRALLELVSYWTGFIQVGCGAIICARLLFARERRPFEKWLGYIFAALALYGLAWAMLRVIGLDLNAMLAQREEAPSLARRAWNESFGIAFGVASAWTGLFVARRRSFVAATVPDAATVAYLCSASLLFYLGLRPIFSIGRILDDVGPLALSYGAAAFTYLGLTLLASLHAARMTAGATSAQPAPKPDARRYGRLLVETPIGLVASAALMGVGYFFVSRIDIIALAFLMPLAMLLLFVGPIVVFIYGILCGRLGYALGAVLLALGLFGYRSYNLMQVAEKAKTTVAEASALTLYPFKPAKQSHTTVAVVDSYTSPVDHVSCYERCRLVLLSSTYTYAVEDPARQTWHILRLVRDPAVCSAPEQRESMLDFLALGQVGTCAVESTQAPGADALIIRENQSQDAPIKRQFPKGFRGSAYELLERIDGKDELLGRIVWGGVQPPLLSDQKGESVKFALDEKGFYAAALNLPGPNPPPITAEQAKAATAVYLDQWSAKSDVLFLNSWAGFLGAAKQPEAIVVLKDAVVALIRSDNPARARWGLSLLNTNALRQDPDLVKSTLAELVTNDHLKIFAEQPYNLLELLKSAKGAYPEPQRAAARTVLERPEAKSQTELIALLSILGHGGAEQRRETAALILALPEAEFRQVMIGMGDLQNMNQVIEPPIIGFWSEAQVREIARRAASVPDESLERYLNAVRFTSLDFVKVSDDMKALVDTRLAAGPADPKVRESLQRLREGL